MNAEATKLRFKLDAVCIVIPTYNNGRTVADVVRNVLEYCEDIIVVNDGSTDNTDVEMNGISKILTTSMLTAQVLPTTMNVKGMP